MNIEKILRIKFNKKQKASATALRWLLNEGSPHLRFGNLPSPRNRGTGRTELIQALLIEKALKNKGKKIPLFDHAILGGQVRSRYSYIALLKKRLEARLRGAGIANFTITSDGDNFNLVIN